MNIDPTASLRRWAVTVELAGRPFRIPPLGADAWLLALHGSYARIVPGLFELDGDAQDDLLDLMMAGRITLAECQDAARDAIGTAAGMKWWAAVRLGSYALQEWGTIGGALLMRGVDPAAVSFGAFLAATYRFILENCKGEPERQKLDIELLKVPPGVSVEEMIDRRAASAAFMALAAADGD